MQSGENSTTEENNNNNNNQNNNYPIINNRPPQAHTWDWIQCSYDLKQFQGDTEIVQNLSPSIVLNVPGNAQNQQNQQQQDGIIPQTKLNIEMNKEFIFSEGLGYNWHKSWNIPDIYCTLDIRDPQTQEKLLPPQKLHAELFVCRAMINDLNSFHLLDVGVKGTAKVDFEGVKCVFSGLKFNSTSYNYEGSKFHLVIVIYLTQTKFEHPKILESKISPPIFVDSRKSARDTQKQKTQKLSSFIEAFSPDNLEKQFVKRESKKKQTFEEVIENNFEGLVNFFSAPNIRHKVKHPLFLAIRFSKCIKLYYNQDSYQDNKNEQGNFCHEKFIENVQKTLHQIYTLQNNTKKNNKIELQNKPLILVIKSSPIPMRKYSNDDQQQQQQPTPQQQEKMTNKSITEFLEPIIGEFMHLLQGDQEIPENFEFIEDIDSLVKAYNNIYPKLSQEKFEDFENINNNNNQIEEEHKQQQQCQQQSTNKKKRKASKAFTDINEETEHSEPQKHVKTNNENQQQQQQMPQNQSEINIFPISQPSESQILFQQFLQAQQQEIQEQQQQMVTASRKASEDIQLISKKEEESELLLQQQQQQQQPIRNVNKRKESFQSNNSTKPKNNTNSNSNSNPNIFPQFQQDFMMSYLQSMMQQQQQQQQQSQNSLFADFPMMYQSMMMAQDPLTQMASQHFMNQMMANLFAQTMSNQNPQWPGLDFFKKQQQQPQKQQQPVRKNSIQREKKKSEDTTQLYPTEKTTVLTPQLGPIKPTPQKKSSVDITLIVDNKDNNNSNNNKGFQLSGNKTNKVHKLSFQSDKDSNGNGNGNNTNQQQL